MTRHVLLSVKPRFANALLDGTKTAEVRRRFPSLEPDTLILLYSSSPERRVIGTVRLETVTAASPTAIWDQFASNLAISGPEFTDYLAGLATAVVIQVHDPIRWQISISLAELRLLIGVQPPQSYRYISREQLLKLGGQ